MELFDNNIQAFLILNSQRFNRFKKGAFDSTEQHHKVKNMVLLKLDSTGTWVRELQQLLTKNGIPGVVDGNFNLTVEENVKSFQKRNQMNITGQVDDIMWNALGWNGNVAEKKITEVDIQQVAVQLDVEIPVVKAVFEVESRGSGFLADGRPKILFEGHIFWSQLKKKGIDPLMFAPSNPTILFPVWTRDYYKGGALEYDRLNQAQSIDNEAALASASWGAFQIMGFNYKVCGYSTVFKYVDSSYIREGEHLKAFGWFITTAGLLKHLKNKDWASFAKGYNGPSYKQNNYDVKLEAAYTKYLGQ